MIDYKTKYIEYIDRLTNILIKAGFTEKQAMTLSILFISSGPQNLEKSKEKLDEILEVEK